MAVAIRLSRDVSKGAPDLLKPAQFRKGQIVRIEGSIHRPDEVNSRGERYEEWVFWENPDIDLAIIFGEEDVSEVYVWQGRCQQCKPIEYVAVYQCPGCGEEEEESEYQRRKPDYYCTKCRMMKGFKRGFLRERKIDPCDHCRAEYEEELKKFRGAPWPIHYAKPEEMEAGK